MAADSVKRRLYRYALSDDIRRHPGASETNPATPGQQGTLQARMIIVGDDPANTELVDGVGNRDTYETLDDGTLVPTDEWRSDNSILLEELEYRGFDEMELPSTIYVSYYSLSKLFVQALGFPFIANAMGHLLEILARPSPTLQRLLGIMPGMVPEHGHWLDFLWATETPNPLWNALPFESPRSMLPAVGGGWVDDGPFFDDLDPVWYRNAIGGMIYLVLKDCVVLWYRYLRLQQHRQLRVKDLPFSEGVAKELARTPTPGSRTG
ncbi:hypothetical protein MSPP1_002563 [Malassezia sp. CBS 17886]|nr:hypothetical protein MSPP1_002563 [Malassezia sp. CBS 17886]